MQFLPTKFFAHFFLGAIFLTALSSCQGQSTPERTATSPASTQTEKSASIFRSLEVDGFAQVITQRTEAQILDVRTPGEFAEGHLVNAHNINVYASDFQSQFAKLDPEKPVMVYCTVGVRSAQAAKVLRQMGFKEIYDLRGGYNQWLRKGLAVTR